MLDQDAWIDELLRHETDWMDCSRPIPSQSWAHLVGAVQFYQGRSELSCPPVCWHTELDLHLQLL